MKIKLTRVLAFLLLFVFCFLFALGAYGKRGERETYAGANLEVLNDLDDYPIIKDEFQDQVTLKLMASCSSTIDVDWKNNKFFQRMNELTGVNFNFDNVYLEDMYKQKKGLVFTSEDSMPDVFFKAFFNNFDEVTYGSSGQILPLNQLIKDHAPNIQKLLDENPIIKRCITTTDGNIYTLPTMYLTRDDSGNMKALNGVMRGFWWINTQWLKDVGEVDGQGKPLIPSTIEDLYRVLTKFKQQKCTAEFSTPLVICGFSELMNLFPIFGLDLSQYYVQAGADGKLIFGPQTENFKVALEWFRKFFDEGLINEDWNTFTETKKYSYGRQDIYGMYQAASPVYVSGANRVSQFVTVDPMTSSVNSEKFWAATYPLERGCFAITSACKYPELAIRWIDTLYDTEAPYWIWAINGKENAEWQWSNPAEKTEWKSLVSDAEYADRMGNTIVQPGDGMPYAVDESFFDKENSTTNSANYVRPQRNRQIEFGKVNFPMVYFSKTDLRTLSGLSSDIDTYVRRYIAAAINEGITDQSFNDFKAFSGYKLDEYLDILQRAYNNFYGL